MGPHGHLADRGTSTPAGGNDRSGVLQRLRNREPLLWLNPAMRPVADALPNLPLGRDDIDDASARLERFAPLVSRLFEDARASHGIIESELMRTDRIGRWLSDRFGVDVPGRMWVKADHALPVAGSIKARGGIYEVLHFAESLALAHGLIDAGESYARLAEPDARAVFGEHTVSVASTGNLGLSIGVTSAGLGFRARVHMSHEAKEWKKRRLRERGVEVVEHGSDVTEAGRIGRQMAAADPRAHFVDDENSSLLFVGYSVAALRLRTQFDAAGVRVDAEHPLFVYLPCGLGGAPTGVTFGLKHVFGDAVHCFYAEPVEAPCVLMGMLDRFEGAVSVYDIGLTNATEADGLAVATPSRFVGPFALALASGCYTVQDDDLFRFVYALDAAEGIRVEPSAAAGLAGPLRLVREAEGRAYVESRVGAGWDTAHHLVWTTGGLFVPPEEYGRFRTRGERLMG